MPVLTVNGIRINYYDDAPPAGAQNAPAVLLVMGSGAAAGPGTCTRCPRWSPPGSG